MTDANETLIDYVMENEVKEFEYELDNFDCLSKKEIAILKDWINDLHGTDHVVKALFKRLEKVHIYATAFCVRYNS